MRTLLSGFLGFSGKGLGRLGFRDCSAANGYDCPSRFGLRGHDGVQV